MSSSKQRFKVHYVTTEEGWTSLPAASAEEAQAMVEASRAQDSRILETKITRVEAVEEEGY